MKISLKRVPKSMKNQGYVTDAFLERLGVAPGPPHKRCDGLFWVLLGTILAQKSEKRRQGRRKGPQSQKKKAFKN